MIDDLDPKRLIQEAYQMEAVSAAECRTIFLDWALGQPADWDVQTAVSRLLAHFGMVDPDHPMTEILEQAKGGLLSPQRRGGRSARLRPQ